MLDLTPGDAVVASLIDDGHLHTAVADRGITRHWLDQARTDLDAAAVLIDAGLPNQAVSVAYDALRKTFTAFLNEQGLRPVSGPGFHITVLDAALAQTRKLIGGAEPLLRRIREFRNAAAYGTDLADVDSDVARDSVDTVTRLHQMVTTTVERELVPLWTARRH
jgi:uncharacterized protein (UPF0332 family)